MRLDWNFYQGKTGIWRFKPRQNGQEIVDFTVHNFDEDGGGLILKSFVDFSNFDELEKETKGLFWQASIHKEAEKIFNLELHDMTKLIIFDKDQTLIDSLCGERFIQSPTDQKILPGAAEAVANFHERGYQVAIASNQGGVEMGKKSLESAIEEMEFCLGLFPKIEFGLFAPNYKGDVCFQVFRDRILQIQYPENPVYAGYTIQKSIRDFGSFRKPGPGMLNLSIWFYNSSPGETCFVGDRPEDHMAAEAAGCQFMAADVVRDRYLPGFSELRATVDQLEILGPSGVYKWQQ